MKEFIDTDHPIVDKFNDLIDDNITKRQIPQQILKLQQLIQEDPDYYDSYLYEAGYFDQLGNAKEAANLIELAFHRAKDRVMEPNNTWPDKLEWEMLNNRHILRTFLNQAQRWWNDDQLEDALAILKQMLRMDPVDNAGARFLILAIRLGMTPKDYDKKFEVKNYCHALSADIFPWFEDQSRYFPQDFGEWDKIVKKLLKNRNK